LHIAASGDDTEMAAMVKSKGPDITLTNDDGKMPFQMMSVVNTATNQVLAEMP
jgi:hypothetical protein